uniref:Uncharacterized protein n=1 Tax=Chromera velia CCMP2878 TaxID=1169474 RepID=A0A0G4FV28_9ALVE|eukprot:Cvel_18923.t1-p1 / transcript=Cvel_18923.t1 / gene=Cvel_18923 / organism=Chromera_velia_CCMP2878 / gene_product=hypothetical protein / transcript_product=hypothetical protein / location=Cvel_scaffold1596:9107-13282(+) / protein_length=207 / sequence_SO=supercontig / SO=protein_coding / is_pseudo=false
MRRWRASLQVLEPRQAASRKRLGKSTGTEGKREESREGGGGKGQSARQREGDEIGDEEEQRRQEEGEQGGREEGEQGGREEREQGRREEGKQRGQEEGEQGRGEEGEQGGEEEEYIVMDVEIPIELDDVDVPEGEEAERVREVIQNEESSLWQATEALSTALTTPETKNSTSSCDPLPLPGPCLTVLAENRSEEALLRSAYLLCAFA